MTATIAGMRVVGGSGEGVQVEGRAGVRGAAPVRPRGGGLGGGLSRNELKMFREQILSRNEARFVSLYYKKISPPPPPCQESRGRGAEAELF